MGQYVAHRNEVFENEKCPDYFILCKYVKRVDVHLESIDVGPNSLPFN